MTKRVLHTTVLSNASQSLQALHHRLLRFQANQMGFNGSPLQLFERATKDAAFSWLKPLRETIVALDERRAAPEPITDVEQDALTRRCRTLLDTHSGPIAGKLKTAFQSDPETIWVTHSARKAVGALG